MVAEEHGVDKVAGLVSITDGVDRTGDGDINKNSGQSFLDGKDGEDISDL